MNAIFFGLKRAHHGTLRVTRTMLRSIGLTAARFDMMFVLLDRPQQLKMPDGLRGLRQTRLRKTLGVSRPTVSRMLASLEELGLVTRHRCVVDRRQLRVSLTARGRWVIRRANRLLRDTGWAQLAVDSALAAGFPHNRWYDEMLCLNRMSSLDSHLEKIRYAFCDFASLHYRWSPDY